MNFYEQKSRLIERGIIPGERVQAFITDDVRRKLAMDASLITDPNSAVPAIYTAFLDPTVIDILTAPRNAREIFPEAKKGDWTDAYTQFRVSEIAGHTTPYTDYGNGGMSDINVTFPTREQYVFQTTIRYGVREMEVAGKANIQMVSEQQRAAATIIDIDSNKFYCLGVQGKEIYGLLNDPNIPAAMPIATPWAGKDGLEIYNDFLALFGRLVAQSQGMINNASDLVLALAPSATVQFETPNQYGLTPHNLMQKYAPNCKIVSLPELDGGTSGNTIILAAQSVLGTPTAHLAFSDKMRMMQVIPKASSYEQKAYGTTYGCILYRPFAVAMATGA